VLVAFPDPHEVVVIDIGRHDPKRSLDIYRETYGRLGLPDPPKGSRTKPPCCDPDGRPPVDTSLLATFDAMAKDWG
jgi:hypothetical protein